ncbi:maltase A3-like isoform X2 [Macrobrachium nipponense]|uniref:maltase A3-like isoform X2 n=1 Tax=Macrobrachium nipponense TaxID=159736 RepID=UPI0030C88DDD
MFAKVGGMSAKDVCQLAGLFVMFIGVIIIIVVCWTAEYGRRDPEIPFWKQEVIYQVYPGSLYDYHPNGFGDLKGITSKVEYFKELGVGAIWLSPVYTSPMADYGYDIANFTDIDPLFGTMKEFEELLETCHVEGLKVIMDFVPNHSSDEHDWFIRSVKKENPYTDYYIWSDPVGFNASGDPLPPNNWLSVFRGSAWTWSDERKQFYYHQFLEKQPDLNFRCPDVQEEMLGVLKFWLDKGVDGFRVDALKHLFEVEDIHQDEPVAEDSGIDDKMDYGYLNHTLTVNQPETFGVLRQWRELLDHYPDKLLMVEVYEGQEIDMLMKYYGNETSPLADFPFNFFMIEKLQNRTELSGHSLKAVVDLWLDNMPSGKWPNWVLGNHDNRRIGSRLGEDMVDAFNMMALLLPGTAITYYGEETGMEDTWISWEDTKDPQGCRYGPKFYSEYSRDPERTPMQWANTTLAGFTSANHSWLPINENYKTVNVEAQKKVKFSHLKVYQSLTHLRKAEVFLSGSLAFPVVTKNIFSFVRVEHGDAKYLIVINTSEEEVIVNLHRDASFDLPETGVVVLRSVTDTSEETYPGSKVSLKNVKMVGGEGLVFSLIVAPAGGH